MFGWRFLPGIDRNQSLRPNSWEWTYFRCLTAVCDGATISISDCARAAGRQIVPGRCRQGSGPADCNLGQHDCDKASHVGWHGTQQAGTATAGAHTRRCLPLPLPCAARRERWVWRDSQHRAHRAIQRRAARVPLAGFDARARLPAPAAPGQPTARSPPHPHRDWRLAADTNQRQQHSGSDGSGPRRPSNGVRS